MPCVPALEIWQVLSAAGALLIMTHAPYNQERGWFLY